VLLSKSRIYVLSHMPLSPTLPSVTSPHPAWQTPLARLRFLGELAYQKARQDEGTRQLPLVLEVGAVWRARMGV
jgi:hypothetical protein